MRITLTAAGVEAAGSSERPDEHGEVFADLTPEEQENLGAYLDRVIAALEKTLW
jgi:hypothetical protein